MTASRLDAASIRTVLRSRDGDDDSRVWSTLSAALVAHLEAVHDGAGVQSTSDPQRFGSAHGGGGRRLYSARDRLVDVARVLADAEAVYGHLVVAAMLVRWGGVPVLRRVGSDADKRKSRCWHVRAATTDELREASARVRPSRAKEAREYVAGALTRAGLLVERARRTREPREDDDEMQALRDQGYDLEGWAQIAARLGVDERTARAWVARYSEMPVRRLANGRVWARSRDLDAWALVRIASPT